jgi:glycosyltransferase involved in cell wall biosynthesis
VGGRFRRGPQPPRLLRLSSARLSPTPTLMTTHGRLDLPDLIEFVGEVDEAGKDDLLGGAWACLFPIDWPEPFGLTMAEAMATGTPVVAYRAGSVPEVVADGTTGFVCETISGMIEAVGRVGDLDRRACRERVERLYSPVAMADGYDRAHAAVVACR